MNFPVTSKHFLKCLYNPFSLSTSLDLRAEVTINLLSITRYCFHFLPLYIWMYSYYVLFFLLFASFTQFNCFETHLWFWCINTLLPFILGYYYILWIYCICGYLGGFQLLVIIEKAFMNVCEQFFFVNICFHICWLIGVEWMDHMIVLCLTF